jgi:hypothetical protein
VSHWWGEPVHDFYDCLVQHSKDHRDDNISLDQWKVELGLSYWICAYANNQWRLELDVDLEQTSFRKALNRAEGTVTVLDKRGETSAFVRSASGFESTHLPPARQLLRATLHALSSRVVWPLTR